MRFSTRSLLLVAPQIGTKSSELQVEKLNLVAFFHYFWKNTSLFPADLIFFQTDILISCVFWNSKGNIFQRN